MGQSSTTRAGTVGTSDTTDTKKGYDSDGTVFEEDDNSDSEEHLELHPPENMTAASAEDGPLGPASIRCKFCDCPGQHVVWSTTKAVVPLLLGNDELLGTSTASNTPPSPTYVKEPISLCSVSSSSYSIAPQART
jgi:hypothetical protein